MFDDSSQETSSENASYKKLKKLALPISQIDPNPKYGGLGQQTHQGILKVGQYECTFTIVMQPKSKVVDIASLPEFLFNSSLKYSDITTFCHDLHTTFQEALDPLSLNIKLEAKSGENVTLSTSKKMKKSKPPKEEKPESEKKSRKRKSNDEE